VSPTGVADLAAAVRSGERSARSVVEEALDAMAASDADLHAFVHVMDDEARAQADAVDEAVAAGRDPGPLAGVPVALKDNLCVRGVPTTCSSRILEGWRPPYDATVVRRLRFSQVGLGPMQVGLGRVQFSLRSVNLLTGPVHGERCVPDRFVERGVFRRNPANLVNCQLWQSCERHLDHLPSMTFCDPEIV